MTSVDQLRKSIVALERSYDLILQVLGESLRLKDLRTHDHSKRVAAFSIFTARHMGMEKHQVSAIGRGAFLHDLGKIATPDSILLKSSSLSADELSIMQKYCQDGYEVVRKVPFLADAADIVYSHQENYNGSGYPRGLRAETIPFGGRVVAVLDAFDAMTSDTPYHSAWPFKSAREEIQRGSGSQFDPDVVRAFLAVPTSAWEDLLRQMNGP